MELRSEIELANKQWLVENWWRSWRVHGNSDISRYLFGAIIILPYNSPLRAELDLLLNIIREEQDENWARHISRLESDLT